MVNKTKQGILALMEEKGDPPPLPDILVTLERRINDPNCDIDEISTLIESDPILAGKLIKLSKTVYFSGGREEPDTLVSAVLRVGIKMVLELAYTSTLPKLFRNCKGINLHQFWEHSLSVAFLSQALGRKAHLSEDELKVSYLAGLMHDMGILIFDYLIHDEYCEFLINIKPSSGILSKLEEEKFGISHAELGAAFIKKWWPIPSLVSKAITRHHFFNMNPSDSPSLSLAVCMANQIANEHNLLNGIKGDLTFERLDDRHFEILNISPQKLEKLVEETREKLAGVAVLLEE